MIVDPVDKSKNLSRIENVFWIERALDFAHDVEECVAELVTHVFGARDANAMLGRDRTLELSNERGSPIGNKPILSQIRRRVKIEDRSHVKQTARGVTVVARLQIERLHDSLHTADVIWQLRGAYGGVLNKRDWLFRTDASSQKRKTGFAHRPNEVHFVLGAANFCAQSKFARFQGRQSLIDVIVKFHEQHRFTRLRV